VSIDDEDAEMSKHKHQRQAELEDDIEEEVEEDVEQVEEIEEEEEAPVGQQEILSLREQLKEEIRRKNAAMAAGTSKASSVNQMIMLPAKDG
jgi:protein SPT2